jgi:hypothetical protein
MRVLTGGGKRVQEASIRLRGETPERRAASNMLELAAERAARAGQPNGPGSQPQRQRPAASSPPAGGRVAPNPVILEIVTRASCASSPDARSHLRERRISSLSKATTDRAFSSAADRPILDAQLVWNSLTL